MKLERLNPMKVKNELHGRCEHGSSLNVEIFSFRWKESHELFTFQFEKESQDEKILKEKSSLIDCVQTAMK